MLGGPAKKSSAKVYATGMALMITAAMANLRPARSRVSTRLLGLPEPRTASEEPIVRELERLRSVMLSGDEHKDISALAEQWHHQSSILQQLRNAAVVPKVDPRSPYFAHLRLREKGEERDLCLGKATCIERGVRKPALLTMGRMAKALETRLSELVRTCAAESGGTRPSSSTERLICPDGPGSPRSCY